MEKLILSKELRESIGLQAYNEAMENHVTIKTGTGLRDFIMHKLNKNISFVLPSTNVSGGIMVATKHAIILKNNGYDVTMININKETEKVDKIYEKNEYINVVPVRKTEFLQHVDEMVATMWLTLKYVKSILIVLIKDIWFKDMKLIYIKKAHLKELNVKRHTMILIL